MLNKLRQGVGKAAALGLFALAAVAFLFLLIGRPAGGGGGNVSATGKWTCSMCPQFILPDPGKCPKCFMDLIPLEEGAYGGSKLSIALKPETADLAGIETAVVETPDTPDTPDTSDTDAGAEAPHEPLPVVPASAVLENVGRTFVYTESFDGENVIFTLTEIELGPRVGDGYEVAGGLYEGEVVVSKGAFRIDSAMQILGKTSLVNLPDGDLASVDDDELPPYQPAERSGLDVRAIGVPIDDWFRQYELVRAALAKDDLTAAEAPAREFAREVSEPDSAGDREFAELHRELSEQVGALANAGTLDGVRDVFDKVSAEMTLLARRYGTPAGGLNLIYCPMAFGGTGAYWLQPQETVDNPYHGLEMPLCGWRVESIDN